MARYVLSICLVLLTGAAASSAWAQPFVLTEGGAAEIVGRDTVIIHDDGLQTLIEQVDLEAEAGLIGWVRAFPKKPEVLDEEADLFDRLDAATTLVPRIRDEVVAGSPGPSVLTLLKNRFFRRAEVERAERPTPDQVLSLTDHDAEMHVGEAGTSTATGERVFPESFSEWISRYSFELSDAQGDVLADYFNRGHTVVTTALPTSEDAAIIRVGPTAYDFESERIVDPARLSSFRPRGAERRIWVFASGPKVSSDYLLEFDREPWVSKVEQPDVFRIVYAAPVAATGDRLSAVLGELPSSSHVVRGALRMKSPAPADLSFVEAPKTPQITLEGEKAFDWSQSERGTLMDWLAALLFALLPLFITPESWFAWYVVLASRSQAEGTGERPFAAVLLPTYAAAVTLYWALTLENEARWVAVAPFLLGLASLQLLRRLSFRRPVRARLKRQRRGK